DVTVLFADIVAFTPLASRLPAAEVVGLLDRLFARFDELVAERGLEKIKTIGDAYMAAGGIPEPVGDHAARVVDLGLAMIDVAENEGDRIAGLQLRIGVHSGPVIGGVIGSRKFAFDIWGETVNIARRLESQGVPGSIPGTAGTSPEGAGGPGSQPGQCGNRAEGRGPVRGGSRRPGRDPRVRTAGYLHDRRAARDR